MRYATFWHRLVAMFVDALLFLPLGVAHIWLASASKTAAILLVVPMAGAYAAYSIFFHGRFGQTIGKQAAHIRVVRVSGDRIGWREAWLRSSVDVAISIVTSIGMLWALTAIRDADYYRVDWLECQRNLHALQPDWVGWAVAAGQCWYWSELVVMLFNRKRRALHDFLAGTVVVAE
jgi:uncharacterized RDD family membrane protein YckC